MWGKVVVGVGVVYVVTTKPTKQKNNDANGSCTMKSVCFELVWVEVVIDGSCRWFLPFYG
jgi:hypothetical protein